MFPAAYRNVLKLFLYAAAVVICAAWLSPLLYNAGQALAEVTEYKTTNRFLHWLGKECKNAEFPAFYTTALAISAALLFLPWFDSLSIDNRFASPAPAESLISRIQRAIWETSISFFLAAAILLPTFFLLSGAFAENGPPFLLRSIVIRLPFAFLGALAIEWFFRGLVFRIFMNVFSLWGAIFASALFFTLFVAVLPPSDIVFPDPEEVPWSGFLLFKNIALSVVSSFHGKALLLPTFLLGGFLSFTRWRTASLALPIGMQTVLLLIWLIHGIYQPFPVFMAWLALLILGTISVAFKPRATHDIRAEI